MSPSTRTRRTISYLGIGISIFLLAAGAILTFAVDKTAEGINLDMVGVVLMVVGGIGLLYSLVVADALGRRDRNTVVRECDVPDPPP